MKASAVPLRSAQFGTGIGIGNGTGAWSTRSHSTSPGGAFTNKPPAFQLYVKDWESSHTVRRMSYEERGIYITLLVASWGSSTPGSLDLPPEIAARSAGIDPRTLRRFLKKYPQTFRRDGERLINDKLYTQWLAIEELRDKRAAAGKAGNEVRWASQMRSQVRSQTVSQSDRSASASASSSSLNSSSSQDPKIKPSHTSPNGQSVCPGFLEFWHLYPVQEGQVRARYAWIKNNLEERAAEIIASLLDWKRSPRWSGDPKYIPNASTFLEEGRWKESPHNRPKKESLNDQLQNLLGEGKRGSRRSS